MAVALNEGSRLQRVVDLQAGERAKVYAEEAQENLRRDCGDLTAVPERADCVAEITEAYREAQRSERDLQAQQTMAVWTRVMGQAAIIGMGVGVFGLVLIFTTFQATREAAQSSQKTLRAYVAKERAVLRFGDYINFEPASNEPHKVQNYLVVYNRSIGNAVVEDLQYAVKADAEWPHSFDRAATESAFVEAQEKGLAGRIVFAPPDAECFYLLGFIEYSTVGEDRYRSHFCYMINPSVVSRTEMLSIDRTTHSGHMRKFPSTPRDT